MTEDIENTPEDFEYIEQPISPEDIPDDELAPFVFEDTVEETVEIAKHVDEDFTKYDLDVIDEKINVLNLEINTIRSKILNFTSAYNKSLNTEEDYCDVCDDSNPYLVETCDVPFIESKIKELENEISNINKKINIHMDIAGDSETTTVNNNVVQNYILEEIESKIKELENEIIQVNYKIAEWGDMLNKILSGESDETVEDVLDEII
jgi:DNA repair exonuclease SbcCD ATPase subunit